MHWYRLAADQGMVGAQWQVARFFEDGLGVDKDPAQAFNNVSGVPVVLPVTSGGNFARMRGFAVSLTGAGLSTQGVIRCDQPRAIDLCARKARRSRERVPQAVMNDVLARLATLFE